MRAYLYSGAHFKAIKVFRGIATGKTAGFLTETPPGWAEIPAVWEREGQEV